MRRWMIAGVLGLVAASGVVIANLAARPEPFDAFPLPPSPSLTPDGSRVFTILPGTEVNFTSRLIAPGDLIAYVGKSQTTVPPLGGDIRGRIIVDTSPNGDVIASCEPHPLTEM